MTKRAPKVADDAALFRSCVYALERLTKTAERLAIQAKSVNAAIAVLVKERDEVEARMRASRRNRRRTVAP